MKIKRVVRLRNLSIILVLLIVALATVSFDLSDDEEKVIGVFFSPTGVLYSGVDGSTNPEEDFFVIQYRDVTAGGTYNIITSTTPGQANYIPGQTGIGGTFQYDSHPYSNYIEGHTYEAQVRASNAAGSSPWIPSPAFTFTMPPADPGNINAIVSVNGVDISFDDNSNYEIGFRVERSGDNLFPLGSVSVVCSSLQTTSNLGTGVMTCTDTDTLSPGSYYYRAQALGPEYNSDYVVSGEVVISGTPTPPSPPNDFAGVGVSTATSSSVDLTWTDSNADEYLVQRDDGTDIFVPVASCGVDGVVPQGDGGCTDTDSALQAGQSYTYQIEGFSISSGFYSIPITVDVSIPVFAGNPVITDISSSTGTGTGGVLDPAIVEMTQGTVLSITGGGFSTDAKVFIAGIEFGTVVIDSNHITVNLINDNIGSLVALCPLNVNALSSGCNAGIHALTVENVPAIPGSVGSGESYIKLEAPAPVINSLTIGGNVYNPSSVVQFTLLPGFPYTFNFNGVNHIREELSIGYAGTYVQLTYRAGLLNYQGGMSRYFTQADTELSYNLNNLLVLDLSSNVLVPGNYEFKTSNPNQVSSIGNNNGISENTDPSSPEFIFTVGQSTLCNPVNIPTISGIIASSSGTDIIDNRGTTDLTIIGTGFVSDSEVILGGVVNIPASLTTLTPNGDLIVQSFEVEGMPPGVYDVFVSSLNCVSYVNNGVVLTVNEETPQITLEFGAISEGGNSDIFGTVGNGFYGSNSWNAQSEVGFVDSAGNGFLPMVLGGTSLYSYISSIKMNFNVLNYPLGTYYTAVRNPSGAKSNVDTFDIVASSCGNGYPDASEECGEPGLTCSTGTCNANTCLCEGGVDPPGPGPGPGGPGGGGPSGGSSGGFRASQCNNNIDDDGDGYCDWDGATAGLNGCSGEPDPGCAGASDNDEFNTISLGGIKECNDGMDNDQDGKIDFPNDPDCDTATDNSEAAESSTVGGFKGDELGIDYVKVIKGTIIGILIAGIIVVALLIVRTLRRKSTFIELAKKSPVVNPDKRFVTYKSK